MALGQQGHKFRFQHRIGPFMGDFVCLELRLIVEADGGQHNPQIDRPRAAYLRKRGFRIVRFWNHDILRNIDGVLETLLIILDGGGDPRD
ncbi:MAG: endonuclease domain-containing protein [Allosphingosinicella sp.]